MVSEEFYWDEEEARWHETIAYCQVGDLVGRVHTGAISIWKVTRGEQVIRGSELRSSS